ncbi:GntR family transcriptional regulator [Rhizobium sp. RCAM05350]|nr:GntR family transcriptional regulator [Rhizobium sp. RCAM05350]
MEDGARASAVDGMVDHIRGLIHERGLTVGDVLPSEAELAVMFDASRNTVREAFRTLKAYGVARIPPEGRGGSDRPASVGDARPVFLRHGYFRRCFP